MPETKTAKKQSAVQDGRRLRTQKNRDKVIRAMITLIATGDLTPSAEAIAAEAGVGMRSVFRYFDDMESMLHEIIVSFEAQVHPLTELPFEGQDLKSRLLELIDQRIVFYEKTMSFKIAAALKRHRSVKLVECYRRDMVLMQTWLKRAVGDEIDVGSDQFEALDAVLSFEMWRRLRKEQEKTVTQGQQILTSLILGVTK
jgi:AcrR family transcriptional regulator